MITGFAFDLDGVITDTAKYHFLAWKQMAKDKLGLDLSEDFNEKLKGKSRVDSLAEILKLVPGETLSDEDKRTFASYKNSLYQEFIKRITASDILPGMLALLNDIQNKGIPMAIASASYNAPTILQHLGLTNMFQGIVNPGDLRKGKPDPEIFERAAQLIASPVATTVGLEDAAAGIQAINAAGEFSVGIGSRQTLKAAKLIFSSTREASLNQIVEVFDRAQYRTMH